MDEPCRRRAIEARRAALLRPAPVPVEFYEALTGGVAPPPEIVVRVDAPQSPPKPGECPKCRKHIGRGVAGHVKKCQGQA